MNSTWRMTCLVLAMPVLLAPGRVLAKECKSADQVVEASSRQYRSRSFGAFPGSWSAWRKEARRRFGDGWQAWRRACARKVTCDQRGGLWTCTRTAIPCRPGSGGCPIDDSTPSPLPVCDSKKPLDEDYVEITELLAVGAVGRQVRALQYMLQELCYNYIEADGDYGPLTKRAVIDFQLKKRLRPDGLVGPDTLEALLGDDRGQSSAAFRGR